MSLTAEPKYHSHEDFQIRLQKLEEIKKLGINPFPHKYTPDHSIQKVLQQFEGKEVGHFDDAAAGSTPKVKIAGRLVLFRAMGKNAFGHLQEEGRRIQIMFNRDLTEVDGLPENEPAIKFIEKKLDLGDIIGVEGNLFYTQKGELTIFVKKTTLLCKTLLPLPDKHSGLADKGVLYRKRWLDLLTHKESLDRFMLRSKVIQILRKYLGSAGFLEVETPVLQHVYGGAEAQPFITELNALHQEMFLRISLEIPLKKLIVGGHLKVFEIGKVFRNEGIDQTHNPEFTELEAYAAYWDYNDMMSFVEKMFETIALELFKTTKITFQLNGQDTEIDLKAPWKRLSMKEALLHYNKINVDNLSEEEMKKILLDKAHITTDKLKGKTRGHLIAELFKELSETHLIQPHHIIDHPIETTPLCKLHRDPAKAKEKLVERFESFILGTEFTNAYSELNDPILQRELLVEQANKKAAGDKEASPLDEDFIEAVCQGMPPTGGFGLGVDRMVMLFAKTGSIKDILYFPLVKGDL